MKLGIVSCYFINNYGSVLQSYATQEYFRNMKIDCETISVEKLKPYLSSKRKRYYLRSFHKPGLFFSKLPMVYLKLLQKINYKNLGENSRLRTDKFNTFREGFVLSQQKASCMSELSDMSSDYSGIVVGSDQLWRPDNIFPGYYTLGWVKDTVPMFSYATSFGVSSLDNRTKQNAEQFLKRFSAISVRESSGCSLVRSVIGKEPSLVCDPVLLLSRNEWENMADTSRCPEQKYIFTYFLGDRKECRAFAVKLSQRTGMAVAAVVHNDCYVACDERAEYKFIDCSPNEFLGLIKNAEYICTDSFHATAFSVIFNKNFFVFNRFVSKKHGTNSRIRSFLDLMGLERRLIVTSDEAMTIELGNIEYKAVNEKVKAFIERSKEFIQREIIEGANSDA